MTMLTDNATITPATAPAMSGRLVRREDLTAGERAGMFALLDAHFEGVTPEQFAHDLGEKNWAILLERGGEVVGFSTLLAYESHFGGEPVSVVCSGDTIVRRDAWGSAALPRTWIASVNHLRAHYPRGRYYWQLITSGFRTYHFLPLFWREFYPRHDAPTPPDAQALLDHLAAERFGLAYDRRTGVVRFPAPQRLRGELAGVPPARAANDPHVRFFLDRNPGHAAGDELACLTELTPENLTAAGRRMTRGA